MEERKPFIQDFDQALKDAGARLSPENIFTFLDDYKKIIDTTEDWKNRWEVRNCAGGLAFENGRMDYLMLDLIWMAMHWETIPDLGDALRYFTRMERYVDVLANFDGVTVAQAEMVLDAMESWSKAINHSATNLIYVKMKMYQKLGKHEIASSYKDALLAIEAKTPSALAFGENHCKGCYYTRILQYYTDLGMMDAAIKAGSELFDSSEANLCLTSPRGGAAYLLDGLMEAAMGDHPMAATAEASLRQNMDFPYPAPLRVVVPLLKYTLWKEDFEEAAVLIDNNMHAAETATDTWYAWKFFEAASRHPEFDGVMLMARAEGLRQKLQR